MYTVDPNPPAREMHFRPELFKYNDTGVDTKQLEGRPGFPGFHLQGP